MADGVLVVKNWMSDCCRATDTRLRFRMTRNDVVLSEFDDVVKTVAE